MMVKNAENRSQMEFVSLEEMVPQNHLLRKIDAAIDFNKLYEFVEKLYCEDNGRPSIDPVVLFKIVLIQHIYGISSLRRTLEEVSMNLAYRWFIGYPLNEAVPHFSTVSYNFKHRFNHATVEYVFRWVLKAAAEEGYLDTEAIFVDGTHIKASANLKKQAKKAVPKEAKRYARELFEEVNKDREEHGKKPFSDDSDKKPPEEKETVVSTTDPESGVFHKGEHKKCFAYEAHTACDKHNFILGVHITPGNVHDSVAFDPLYDELCEYYPEHQTVVADSAYKTPWICKRIFESGRTLATCYTRPKTKENGHPWWTYVYDEYFDDVICPEYRALHYTTTNRDGYREYKSRTYFCKNCPTRAQCTENAKCEKTVLRHVWQDFVEMAEHVRHMTVYRELYRLRKEKIERVFADAKEKHGMRYTQYRGLAQVTNWVKLKFAAMNLKKLATWKWNDSHPGPDGGKRRRLSDVYSRFLQFFCFQLKSPLWSVYQNGLFLQPEMSAPTWSGHFLSKPVLCHQRTNTEKQQDQNTQDDAVPAKGLEVVLFHKVHQEADAQQGDDKRDDKAYRQDSGLRTGKESLAGSDLLGEEFAQLQDTHTHHGGDGQEEGELRSHRPGTAQDDSAQDGSAGAGSAGNDGQGLEQADAQGNLPGEVAGAADSRGAAAILDHEEAHAVDDQSSGYHPGVHQMLIHPVIEGEANDGRGDASQNYQAPQGPGLPLLMGRFPGREGVELMEKQHEYG